MPYVSYALFDVGGICGISKSRTIDFLFGDVCETTGLIIYTGSFLYKIVMDWNKEDE